MAFVLAGKSAIDDVAYKVASIHEKHGMQAAVHEREQYAIRTRRMNLEIINHMNQHACEQMVIFGAGMDTRAYTLPCLKNCHVFEVDRKATVQVKEHLIEQNGNHVPLKAASLHRIAHEWTDVNQEDLMLKLGRANFDPHRPTVYVMEGFLSQIPRGLATRLIRLPPLLSENNFIIFDIRKDNFIRDPQSFMICQGYTSTVHVRSLVIDGHPTWIIGAAVEVKP